MTGIVIMLPCYYPTWSTVSSFDWYLGTFWLCIERSGGGEAGQSGPSFRPAGLGQRPPATISGSHC